jgi:hypothetical protein
MQKSLITSLIALASATVLPSNADIVRDCSEFDPSQIKLVTFDVFAALMDLESSLLRNVAQTLPTLSSD